MSVSDECVTNTVTLIALRPLARWRWQLRERESGTALGEL